MIAKVSSCKGGTALFGYVINDKKGYELDRNFLSGQTPKELNDEMKIIQEQNQRCLNNTFSMVISPSVKDGLKLTDNDLKNISKDFLELMNKSPKENQFIAFVHTEKEHKHIHIIMNRIQENGKPMPDKFIGKQAQYCIDQVAQKYGLHSAREMMKQKLEKQLSIDKLERNQMKEKHFAVMKSQPKSFKHYQNLMKEKGIDVQPTINKQGKVQGFRFNDLQTGKSFKASEIDRKHQLKSFFEPKQLQSNHHTQLMNNSLSKSILSKAISSKLSPAKVVKKIIKGISNDYSM